MIDYNVPRQQAANVVGVSLRSIDRYTLSGKLPFKKVRGRVLFNSQDLLNMKIQKNTEVFEDVNTNFNFRKQRIENRAVPIYNSDHNHGNQGSDYDSAHEQNKTSDSFDIVEYVKAKTERDMYKSINDKLQEELKGKQSELERMNYRIGEISSKKDVPLLENQRNKEQLVTLKKEIINLNEELSYQRVIKGVFVGLLFVTVAILSLWYFYTFKI